MKGHVDFAWEVSRSLAACQGALLLIDASQGVQAQTLSVFHVAQGRGIKIIPIMNKVQTSFESFFSKLKLVFTDLQVDLPNADPDRVMAQMHSTFGFDPAEVISVSAKTGLNVEAVLGAIVRRIPPPTVEEEKSPLKALLFDSS